MALPKDPRQKMINIMYLVLTAILALNVSSEILTAFKVVDASLINSNKNLVSGSETVYKSLQSKLEDAKTAEVAKIWQPKAEQAHKLADELNKYIDDLKQELKKESGLVIREGKESFKEDNLDASTRMFGDGESSKGKGKEFKQKLDDFKARMLAIDPEIKAEFEKNFPVNTDPVEGREGGKKDFANAYFHMTPSIAAITLLSKFQNNVRNAENQIASFCHSKIGEVKVRYDKFGVLVGTSSNYVMPGEELEITAGVGAFSSAALPQISINGSNVGVEEGQGKYKITASGVGSRTVPVVVRYTDQNGNAQVAQSEVKYTVGVPSGSAVMLDKMNVFYIGVDNPVTISTSTGWDKATATMTGGSMSGSGSSRIVRVTTPGKATISVTANGKSQQFEFRVKEIPNPVFKVGPGGTRMTAGSFKNQQFCRAELENFDFDAKFSVVSATVYFSGANFSNVQTVALNGNNLGPISAYMQRCGPGSAITFDNVKVQGPDGKQRTIQGVGIVLY